MNKRIIAIVAILTVAAAGAFAQIGLGLNAAIYSDTKMGFSDFGDQLSHGEGVFYGPFVELALGKTALGLSGNFSFYDEDWSFDPMNPWFVSMVDFDLTLYVQGHFISYRSFLDPFLELGLGVMGKDYANESDDPDSENPIMATTYWQVGGGLGINFGGLGIFIKGLYLFPLGTIEGYYWDDLNHDGYKDSNEKIPYTLSEYPLRRLKLMVGAKIIL